MRYDIRRRSNEEDLGLVRRDGRVGDAACQVSLLPVDGYAFEVCGQRHVRIVSAKQDELCSLPTGRISIMNGGGTDQVLELGLLVQYSHVLPGLLY